MSANRFSPEQTRYLEGFVAGADVVRRLARLPSFADVLPAGMAGAPRSASHAADAPERSLSSEVAEAPPHPDALALSVQADRIAAGGKLSVEERAKREKPPLDLRPEIDSLARRGSPPQGSDVFLWKFHGLFWVAPAQDSFMCRLRFPGGIVSARQLEGLADLCERHGGGYVDITTRANLQIREIPPSHASDVLRELQDLGIVTRGAGADNVRNITAPPTAGIDPIELLDTFPLARSLHHHILERRELYGLPRKFNIAFDGGGSTGALEDTNDIGFSARRHAATGRVGFRMALGGITGHRDFAEDSGVFLDPSECIDVAAAVLGVYIREGDRTDRRRARFKHVLDRYGIDAFLRRVEEALGRELPRARLDECEPRPPLVARAHIGIHAQRQNGRFWLGFVPPAGRMPAAAMRTLARLATTRGEGALRLTVWQNAILAGVREDDVERLRMEVEAIGFPTDPTAFGAGVVACTGNRGCKYAATDTKAHALRVVRELEERMSLREPINMHFTGCPHSCAQHFIGDIGLLGTTIESGDDLLEGYRVYVGGGFGGERRIAREVDAGVPASDLPVRLEGMLRAYLDRRRDAEESFSSFCARLDDAELRRVFACGSPSVSAGA